MPVNLDWQYPHYGMWLVVCTTFLFCLVIQDMAIVFSVFIVTLIAWHHNSNLCNLYHLQTKWWEWQRERTFNNKVLRKTFGLMMDEVTGHWTYLHNEEHEIQTATNVTIINEQWIAQNVVLTERSSTVTVKTHQDPQNTQSQGWSSIWGPTTYAVLPTQPLHKQHQNGSKRKRHSQLTTQTDTKSSASDRQ